MNVISRIRKELLGMTQSEVALLLGVSQGTISRWEAGDTHPTLPEIRAMRRYALEKGIPWQDAWLFDENASSQIGGLLRPEDSDASGC